MKTVLRLIVVMVILAMAGTAIVGCGEGACQQEGWYETCVQNRNAICPDIYPKCPPSK